MLFLLAIVLAAIGLAPYSVYQWQLLTEQRHA
jgi:hypothetical protein